MLILPVFPLKTGWAVLKFVLNIREVLIAMQYVSVAYDFWENSHITEARNLYLLTACTYIVLCLSVEVWENGMFLLSAVSEWQRTVLCIHWWSKRQASAWVNAALMPRVAVSADWYVYRLRYGVSTRSRGTWEGRQHCSSEPHCWWVSHIQENVVFPFFPLIFRCLKKKKNLGNVCGARVCVHAYACMLPFI